MIRKYALEQGATLLRRLVFQMSRAAKLRDPESIHDLRVAIRRFQQYLRIFHQFFPPDEAKRVRRRMRKMMELSAEVRNRDIALELLKEAGELENAKLAAAFRQQRRKAQQELLSTLEDWGRRDPSRKWRARLEL